MGKSNDILLELEGHFWWYGETIPEGQYAPPSALPGILTISEDGLGKLVLTGSLMMSEPIKLDNAGRRAAENNLGTLERRTIAGWIEKGFHRVYLRNVVYRRVERSADGREMEKFHAGFSLVGRSTLHQDKSDLTFSRLSIDLSGLEAWRWNDAVTVEPENADETGRSQTVRWQVDAPEYPFKGGRLRLRTDVHCDRLEGMPIREVSFRQYDWLDYIPELHASLEVLKQEFGHIEEFLALLTGTYCYFDWPQISNGEGDKFESFTLYFERLREKMEPLEVTQLWTTFPQVEKQFGALYEKARGMRMAYGAGFYLRFGALRNTSMYVEQRFVNLIWGIESLHRIAYPEVKGSTSASEMVEGFRRIIEAQKTTLNSDERRWLDRATKFASEPNLKDRIEDLFSRLPWRIELSSLAKFAEECAHRRNDLSHHGGPRSNGEHAYETFLRQLMTLSGALSILYHTALLQKIGVDDQTLQLPLERNPVRSRLRPLLTQAELNLPPLDEPAKQVPPTAPPTEN
jgi:hypothetical protein